jgi:hypothetical protein
VGILMHMSDVWHVGTDRGYPGTGTTCLSPPGANCFLPDGTNRFMLVHTTPATGTHPYAAACKSSWVGSRCAE